MNQEEIITDIVRLEEVIRNLPIFANDINLILGEIEASFKALGSTWQDDEYERFKKCFVPLRRTIDEMRSELALRQRSLEEDVERLKIYKSIQTPT